MKPQWKKQNENLLQQQQRMKEIAYYQQQRQQEPPNLKDWKPKSEDEFARVEAETQKLQQELAAGKLDQEAYNKALKALMIADDQGRWWMLGTQTNTWYRNDGENWVVDTPSGRLSPQANISTTIPSRQDPVRTGIIHNIWIKWVFVSTLTSALGIAVASLVGGFRLLVPNILNNYIPGMLIGLALGICQLIVLGRNTRHSFFLVLGYLVSGLIVGISTLDFLSGVVMGSGNAIPGYFIFKRYYKNSGLYLIFRPLILGFSWTLANRLTYSIRSIPFGPNPMLEVAGYGILSGAIAGLIDGIFLGAILIVILRIPKNASD